jgi:hypothetical protein
MVPISYLNIYSWDITLQLWLYIHLQLEYLYLSLSLSIYTYTVYIYVWVCVECVCLTSQKYIATIELRMSTGAPDHAWGDAIERIRCQLMKLKLGASFGQWQHSKIWGNIVYKRFGHFNFQLIWSCLIYLVGGHIWEYHGISWNIPYSYKMLKTPPTLLVSFGTGNHFSYPWDR